MGFSRKVYICSPYRGATEDNVAKAKAYCNYAVNNGVIPIAPHLYLTQFLDDNIPEERSLGLSIGLLLLRECREVWVFGTTISDGMAREISKASTHGIKIRWFNEDCTEREETKHDGTDKD